MTKHNFSDDNAIGKRGEEIFRKCLEKWNCKYTDVSEDARYQEQDIDFIVESRKVDGKTVTVEVKNDQRIAETGNIFFETMSNVDYSTEGCFKKTKAELMAIVSESERLIYFVGTEILRKYINENSKNLRFISRVPGSNSCGYLIPVERIKSDVVKIRY
jgi:hypothetical protein